MPHNIALPANFSAIGNGFQFLSWQPHDEWCIVRIHFSGHANAIGLCGSMFICAEYNYMNAQLQDSSSNERTVREIGQLCDQALKTTQ